MDDCWMTKGRREFVGQSMGQTWHAGGTTTTMLTLRPNNRTRGLISTEIVFMVRTQLVIEIVVSTIFFRRDTKEGYDARASTTKASFDAFLRRCGAVEVALIKDTDFPAGEEDP